MDTTHPTQSTSVRLSNLVTQNAAMFIPPIDINPTKCLGLTSEHKIKKRPLGEGEERLCLG